MQDTQNMSATEAERVPILGLVGADASAIERNMSDLRRMRALRALKTIQEASVRNGTSNMTLEEINAEIDATRAERRAREHR